MLILTEKPNVAAAFSSALCAHYKNGYYENDTTVITSCKGHLFELFHPEDYDARYKTWSLDNLPIIPDTFRYKAIAATAAQTSLVLKLLKAHKNDRIIIATDADREGELIARIVFSEAGLTDTSRCYRFWTSATLTQDSITAELEKVKPWKEYNDLAASGAARQKADWLVGMNMSPYITLVSGGGETFSVGRVQTAVLAAIAQRNKEVKNFVATPYYECALTMQDVNNQCITALLINPDTNKTSFPSLTHYINSACSFAQTDKRITYEIKQEQKKLSAPKLLSLTELSIIAAKEYDYSAAQVERICEKLYDEYKCLSYPRTPSRVMGENDEDVRTFKEKFNLIKDSFDIAQYCDESLIHKNNKNIFDDKKLAGHYALIPFDHCPEKASLQEKNVYNIVCRYFLYSCMPECIYNQKTLTIHNGEYIYRAKINTIVSAGWKAAEKKDDTNNEDELVTFNEEEMKVKGAEIKKKLTTPKKEFTESTLLTFMKSPTGDTSEDGKLVGLGTESTRGKIISILQDRGYVIKDKKKFYATDKGFFLLEQLCKNSLTAKIAKISQTTEWEKKLETNPHDFENEIIEYIRQCVAIKPEISTFVKNSIGNCPLCGNPIQESKSNFFCTGYKNSPKCEFVIWKNIAGAAVTASDAETLLAGKTTASKKMKKKDGGTFTAKLRLNKDCGKIEFVFDNKKKGYKK